ncbi:hypothetical protein J3A83DRAFT_4212457, partial [Scleroderma citrinum]
MASALYRRQLKGLCSTKETLDRAKSILDLALVRTGHGTGFSGNTATLPAVAAYLASEQLGANEVSLNTAAVSACVQPRVFEDILKRVRKAIQFDDDNQEQRNHSGNVPYQRLIASHALRNAQNAVEWMEEAEAALPRVDMMKDRYGEDAVRCGVFLWVCELMEYTVSIKAFCINYNVTSRTLKIITGTLDRYCGDVADRIRSALPQLHSSQLAATSATSSKCPNTRTKASPQKSPIKSAMKGNAPAQESTPSRTPTRKRAVMFSQPTRDLDETDDASFPETPTKKRRIDTPASIVGRTGTSISPAKRMRATARGNEDAHVAAFHAAMTGQAPQTSSPAKPPRPVPLLDRVTGIQAFPRDAELSTPTRPRSLRSATSTTDIDSSAQSPAISTPTRSALPASAPKRPRRRYRPVFLDQQQWLAQDPRVERIWADAATHRSRMIELYGHPFMCNGTTV